MNFEQENPLENDVSSWVNQVKGVRTFNIAPEFLKKQRIKAIEELKNDVVDLRCISWSYMQDLWSSTKKNERFQNVNLFVCVPGKGKQTVTCRKLEQSSNDKFSLITPKGDVVVKNASACKFLKREKWTIRDFSTYAIQAYLNDSLSVGEKCFLDTTFERNVGPEFLGSYVIAQSDVEMDKLMSALEKYFKKKRRKLEMEGEDPDQEFYVWFEPFCRKNTDVFGVFKQHNKSKIKFGELRQTKLYKYIVDVKSKMIPLFSERLVYIDDWKSPKLLTNAFNVWELFSTIQCHHGFTLIYSDQTSKEFHELFQGSEQKELDSNVTYADKITCFDKNNMFETLEYLEPSHLKSRNNYIKTIVIDAASQLMNGFKTVVTYLKKDLCKHIAIMIDLDMYKLIKHHVKNMVDNNNVSATKMLKISERLYQAGILMRFLDESNASLVYLKQALSFYKSLKLGNDSREFKANEAIVFCGISIAKTLRLKNNMAEARKELDDARRFCNQAAFGPGISRPLLQEISLLIASVSAETGDVTDSITRYEDCLAGMQADTNAVITTTTEQDLKKKRSSLLITLPVQKNTVMDFQAFSKRVTGNENYSAAVERKIKLYVILASLYRDKLNKEDKAEVLLYRALDDVKELSDTETVEFAQIHKDLATISISREDYKGAVKKLSIFLDTVYEIQGNCNPYVISALKSSAFCCIKLGDVDQAEIFKKKCRDNIGKYFGVKSKEIEEYNKIKDG